MTSGEILAEVEAEKGDRPHYRRVRDRRRAQEEPLEDRAADRDDQSGHHSLGTAGLETMQRSEQDRAGNK